MLSVSAAEELRVAWSPPGGRVPPHCLEYEVQVAEDAGGAAAAWAVRTAPGEGKGVGEPWPSRQWGHRVGITPAGAAAAPRVFLLNPLTLRPQLGFGTNTSQREDPDQLSLRPPASENCLSQKTAIEEI